METPTYQNHRHDQAHQRTVRLRRIRLLGTVAVATAVAVSGCASSAPSSAKTTPTTADQSVLARLPAHLAQDGITIVVGDPRAKNTIRVYEDPRCPFCAKFERAANDQLARLAADGRVKIEYVIASFLDQRLGGTGSAKAANALRASLGKGKFPQFHQALYAHQMDERVDGYTDGFLTQIAGSIPGLRDHDFDDDITHMTHKSWVDKAQQLYASNAHETPTVVVNGHQAVVDAEHGMYDTSGFATFLKKSGVS
jgi:protein-disulfide isomerase